MTDSLPNMPYARLSKTKAVVEAAVLRQKVLDKDDPTTFKNIQAERYICLDCDAEVRPKCMELGKQFIPFFFLRSKIKDPHRPSCNVRKCEEVLKGKDKLKYKEPILSSTNKVLIKGYPNRLVLDFFSLGTQDCEENDSNPDIGYSSSTTVSLKNDSNITRDWAVTSITPLVKQYLKEDERNFRLVIPGVDVNTYEKVFYKISFLSHYKLYKARIYYGQVIYTAIEKDNNLIRFYLTDGKAEKNSEGQWRLSKKSFFEINLDLCREVEKKEFIKKISELKKNAEEYKRTGQLLQGRFCVWIFFLGYSLDGNNTKFSLCHDSPRLIEFCITDTLNNIKSVAYHSEDSSQNIVVNETLDLDLFVSDLESQKQVFDNELDVESSSLNSYAIDDAPIDLPIDLNLLEDENTILLSSPIETESRYSFLGSELTPEDSLASNNTGSVEDIHGTQSESISSNIDFMSTARRDETSTRKLFVPPSLFSRSLKKALKVRSSKQFNDLTKVIQTCTQRLLAIASEVSLKSKGVKRHFIEIINFLKRR